MNGNERREYILKKLQTSKKPLSGSLLAKEFHVSRQVIVQDIALLRANNYDIISTNRGYILLDSSQALQRVVHVKHDNEHMEDELNTIIDLGGKVLNVIVEHELYGQVVAPLVLNNRREILDFIHKVKITAAVPLKLLSNDTHYHTIEADDEQTLDLIEEELLKKGYLLK
jgi:hypothetical protein